MNFEKAIAWKTIYIHKKYTIKVNKFKTKNLQFVLFYYKLGESSESQCNEVQF